MACTYCPTGPYQKSTTMMTLERGDVMLPEAVSERLDDAMDAAVAAGGTTAHA
jgi:hypothetical protein